MTNSSENDKPQTRRIVETLVNVMVTIWRTSPRAIFIQAVGAVLTASLPLATTYFAALTTTALAEAYAGGDPRQLFAYVVITVILGVIMSFWGIVQAFLSN